ncbi:MAG TPA: type 4a pilus biogenesis protein PilO [Dissulfurispiraceae bacterium]|nr:type 4a pilus biogenesis protein PilO [Dissulfurispiraceae bacterium]
MESIDNLSPAKKNILLVLPPLLIIVLSITFLILPVLDEKNRITMDVEKQRADLKMSEQQANRLTALIAENEAAKKKLLELEAKLPEEKEVSGLLKQVSDLGIRSGLDIVLWRPAAKTVHPSKDVYEIPVNVEMRGAYHKIGQFFSNITKLERIVNLNNISMKNTGKVSRKGTATLVATFTAVTYSSIPEEEKKALEKAEKAEKRSK